MTTESITTTTIQVLDMDCPDCVAKIEGRLSRLEGVNRVTANLMGQSVAIVHRDGTHGREVFRSAVVDMGYTVDSEPETTVLRVPDMDGPACAEKIELALGQIAGVSSVSANTVTGGVSVSHGSEVSVTTLASVIGTAGYAVNEPLSESADPPAGRLLTDSALTGVSGLLFGVGLILSLTLPNTMVSAWVFILPLSASSFLLAALIGGIRFFPSGFRAARTLSLDMDFLMSIAVVGAAAIGEYLEAAAIAFLFSFAELLETRAVHRARQSITSLMSLAPDRATVRREGIETVVPVEEIALDEIVLIRPGEKVSVDGDVIKGESSIDQSMITGESIPVSRTPGDPVYAGTLNEAGYLEVWVRRLASQTTLSRIVRMVQEAEEHKAPIERFVKRFARVYTPAVSVAALAVVLVPTIFLGGGFEDWFVRGLALLVIACPCAMVISTPVAVVSAITSAARNGVLIKGGDHLETFSKISVVALDKTGTLTHGKPEVVQIAALNGHEKQDVLRVAAALERRSSHPIAGAILRASGSRPLPEPEAFASMAGCGVSGVLGGQSYKVGTPAWLALPVPDEVVQLSNGGNTIVVVGTVKQLVGAIVIADEVRPEARNAIRGLKREGIERVVMLTGDNAATANRIAEEAGLDEFRAGLLPEEKVAAVKELTAEYGPVAMVGDGINDAPALATAAVGVAMGAAGSDTAIETADAALMSDDLTKLPYLFRLSKNSSRVIKQNVWAAILIKLTLAIGVFPGFVSLVVAVLVGDLGTSLGVTTNAIRLARVKAGSAVSHEGSSSPT